MSGHYEIYVDGTSSEVPKTSSEQTAVDDAAKLSNERPGTRVEVVVRSTDDGGLTEMSAVVATYVDGRRQPWVWSVSLAASLELRGFSAPGVVFDQSSTVGFQGSTSGQYTFLVGAPDGDAAIDTLKAALGARAEKITHWSVVEANDDAAADWKAQQED